MTKQEAQADESDRQDPKSPSVDEQFGLILRAVAACSWGPSLARAGIVQSNWIDPTWCNPARSSDYLKRWIVEAWIPAAAAISELYSGGRIRVRGLMLKLALGAQPRDATLRGIVDRTQQHFRRLLLSDERTELVDSIVSDLAFMMKSDTVHPEQVHLYFDYLAGQLRRQFVQYLRPKETSPKPRIGRESKDPERDQRLDDAVEANGGKMLKQKEVITLLECTKEEAKDFMHRGRERQRSARLARKRLKPG